ncbi:uncharacterized protein MELLADRAFT_114233 [Melampsora larici-populina 98AG31]|uniref:Uncharacterized protein n=1 Tax=Melampsora larici-populina (strain 98AG31 / pathotype 3-4-7) TaxID=747676 RepID=F4SCQ6_MELLP|nr:uncharacterized protein MELLADRAFT_114233 [Melampsora larici-populina 98AG31]EGF97565.1 hypothetical protein MELLADRAFT_114233 [Melampsora larici-populina 98AG31]
MGMRALARVRQGHEELRRVGWEVQRAMRWATTLHQQLWTMLESLNGHDVDVMEVFLMCQGGYCLRILGNYQHLMPQIMEKNLLERLDQLGVDDLPPAMEEEYALSDINEEDWKDIIDEGMIQNLMNVEGRNEDDG